MIEENLTAFEQQLNDILQGDIWTDQIDPWRPHKIHGPSPHQVRVRNAKLKNQAESFHRRARKFDAMKGLGTIFASGLKLKKAEKKFRSGQSSLFIQ